MFRRVHVRAHHHENRTTILAGMLRAAVAVAAATQITKYIKMKNTRNRDQESGQRDRYDIVGR